MTPPEERAFESIREHWWDEKTARAVMSLNLWFMEACGITDRDIRDELFEDES